MPEYKKGPFNLLPNPPYEELALHSEVFQIWPSGEIFTNYEYEIGNLFGFLLIYVCVDNMLIDFINIMKKSGLVVILERVI